MSTAPNRNRSGSPQTVLLNLGYRILYDLYYFQLRGFLQRKSTTAVPDATLNKGRGDVDHPV